MSFQPKTESVNLSKEEIKQMLKEDLESGRRIRPLTPQERTIYGNAALNASGFTPAFTRAISLLHPFVDATAETCYVDSSGRLGLSYFFLYVITWEQRATWLTHEAMHVLNSHFVRGSAEHMTPKETNFCGDLEINTTLSSTNWAQLDKLLVPEDYGYEKYRTMEYYYAAAKEEEENTGDFPESAGGGDGESTSGSSNENGDSDSDNSSGSGNSDSSDSSDSGDSDGSGDSAGSGNSDNSNSKNKPAQGKAKNPLDEFQERFAKDLEKGSKSAPSGGSSDYSCDESTDAREDEADSAGIERNSSAAQELAREETRERIKQAIESNKMRSMHGSANQFYELMLNTMSPPKADWRDILRTTTARFFSETSQGKDRESFSRQNRRYSGEIIFPGRVQITPTAMFGLDTSLSMGKNDTLNALSEAKEIVEKVFRSKRGIPFFTIDTEIKEVQHLKKISDVNISGGGGTDMAVAFDYVTDLPRKKKPDVFILATDGYVFWDSVIQSMRKCPVRKVILITDAYMNSVPPEAHLLATIIPIGDHNSDASSKTH